MIHNNYFESQLLFAMVGASFCLISFDGCVLDNHGCHGYGGLGFDSGEGA